MEHLKRIFSNIFLSNIFVRLNLALFATQTSLLNTPGNDLSPEMKTYYHDRLLDNAEPKLLHGQFGTKYPIPAHGGKVIEFRKMSALPKALTKINEGVTPAGNSLNVTTVTGTIDQYGDFVEVADILEVTAIDRIVEEATIRLGSQAGRTLDTVVREVLHGGSNKIFAPLVAADGSETAVVLRSSVRTNAKLTPKQIRKAVAKLKRMDVDPIDGSYVAIIHPDISCDLQGETEWIESHKYAAPDEIFNGEIGKIAGVRFIESSEAKIIGPANMLGIEGYTRTTVRANVSNSTDVYPAEPFTVAQATAINAAISAGTVYKLYVDDVEVTVASVVGGAAGTCKIVLTAAVTETAGDPICGTGAGADGTAIYGTLILGMGAFGVTDVSGLGLEHIVKQRGSGGTSDPLNQRSTTGWKATLVAVRLNEEAMIRIEHSSPTFGASSESN